MSNIKPKDIEGDTALDRILKSWLAHDLDSLDEVDKNILTRITELDKRMQEGKLIKTNKKDFSRPLRIKELAEWQVERFKISLRQAYADIEMCKQFFLSTQTLDDKAFARGQMIQQGEELMFEAASNGDFKASAAFFKELRVLRGLDKPEAENVDLSKWEPINPVIVLDPAQLGFEKMEYPDQEVKKLLKSFKVSPLETRLDQDDLKEDV
jgi:hypothetical protein